MSNKINSTKKEKVGKLYVALENGGEVEVPRGNTEYSYSITDNGYSVELEVTASWIKLLNGPENLLDIDVVHFVEKYAERNNLILRSIRYNKSYVFSFILSFKPEIFSFGQKEGDKVA